MTVQQQEDSPARGPAQGSTRPLSTSGFPEHWQHKALAAWDMNARRGVIETGSDAGKAYLGVTATICTVLRDAAVLIVVPHEHRRQQWLATLQRDFSTAPAAGIQILTSRDIVCATAKTASAPLARVVPLVQPFALLIADDCFADVVELLHSPLGVYCERVMGLTSVLPMGVWGDASRAADDDGTDVTPSTLLGGVVYGLAAGPARNFEPASASVRPPL
ncbi:hypothetical protein [Specibacter sp. NPDC078709]|uniref:hypothetical protein n=1 Tax=Specibacter sp. NPDC078709 TaxID=3154364 RepID=UPI0034355FA1